MRYILYSLPKLKPAVISLVFVFFFFTNAFAQTNRKPNIIFILGDDVGFYTPTVNGGQSYSTPNLDSMARHGMNFTHCESSPLCCTSRCMFLTGKYLNRNYSSWGYINDSAKMVGNVMKQAGYTTGIFGKWQLQYSVDKMINWGWDSHLLFELTEDTMTYRRYKNPVLRDNGYRIPDSVMANKYCDDVLTDSILQFIDKNKKHPFFVYYSMSIGHDPFCPTPDDPEFASWNPNSPSDTSFYPSMMKYMDKKIGQILDKLRSTGLANNTLVIYAGDNGTPVSIFYNANGVKHIQGEKGKTTEGGTHVPMMAYWPGHVPAGTVNDDLIDFTDFLPTLAQAGRLTNLSSYGPLDGVSFYPKLLGKKGKTKTKLYCFYDAENPDDSLRIWERDKTYKLYDSTATSKSGLFYNIVKDPKEASPLRNNKLTVQEKLIKDTFQLILDTSYHWPDCPGIINPFVTNITNSSAIVGATITATGASPLIERGTSLSSTQQVFLSSGRMRDNSVSLGQFAQQRTGLKPQHKYNYLVYAMNNNASHSIGNVGGQFVTLSRAPLKQPAKFTAVANNSSITFEWNSAKFPRDGATKAGYLLVYSTSTPSLIADVNGKQPAKIVASGQILIIPESDLPGLPIKKTQLSSFSSDSNYNAMLIPYTWDGINTSTYNYLVKDALIAKLTNVMIALNDDSFDTKKLLSR